MLSDWLRAALEGAEIKQAELARLLTEQLGRSVDRAAVNKMAKGTRDISADEMLAIERITGRPAPQHIERDVPLMGYVGAGAEVMPEFEQVPPEGLRQITIPFPLPGDMIAFEIDGDSMLPRYESGFIVIVWSEQKRPLDSFYGEEALVRTRDGRRFLKSIQRGRDNLVNLLSWNAPPIEDVHLEWIGEIFAVLPRRQIKNIAKQGGIQGQLKLASGA